MALREEQCETGTCRALGVREPPAAFVTRCQTCSEL